MTEENLINLKNKYQEMKDTNDQLTILLDKKERMESLDIVKQYLKLLDSLKTYQNKLPINQSVLTPEELLQTVINSETIENTNNIYVYQCSLAKFYYGTKKQSRGYHHVDVDSPEAEIHVYLDIEKDYEHSTVEIPAYERELFEQNNKVIYPKEGQYSFDCYSQIRKDFFKTAIHSTQEEAIQKVYKK